MEWIATVDAKLKSSAVVYINGVTRHSLNTRRQVTDGLERYFANSLLNLGR